MILNISKAITDNGRQLMEKKYCLPGETIEERLYAACTFNSLDKHHAERLATYISKGWFMFSTPLLANSGTKRGQGISCFLNKMDDSLESIGELYKENVHLTTGGGGIGTHYSSIRSLGESTSKGSETTGVIPFIKVCDSQIIAFNQGLTRRGAGAAFLDVSHPEIMEFLSIRDVVGGDINRKCPSTHIGVCISDKFMDAVKNKEQWDLIDPNSKKVTATLPAIHIWVKILKMRLSTGEPYLYFTDNVIRNTCYDLNNPDDVIEFNGTNLCTEILLHTSDYETAVCCLSSINAAKFFEYKDDSNFYKDMVAMLNVALDNFIKNAPEGYKRAIKSVRMSRDLGLGIMGFHTLCQMNPDISSDVLNELVFSHHKTLAVQASEELTSIWDSPPRAKHLNRVNTNVTAIAPNASSSIMLGVSPGIEPIRSNIFAIKVGGQLLEMKNPALVSYLDNVQKNTKEVWDSIRRNNGSVKGIENVPDNVFKTFEEHDQAKLINQASYRQQYIDQAQSLNLCVSPDIAAKELSDLHLEAYNKGLPTLYYLRTAATNRAEDVTVQAKRAEVIACPLNPKTEEECLACQ